MPCVNFTTASYALIAQKTRNSSNNISMLTDTKHIAREMLEDLSGVPIIGPLLDNLGNLIL